MKLLPILDELKYKFGYNYQICLVGGELQIFRLNRGVTKSEIVALLLIQQKRLVVVSEVREISRFPYVVIIEKVSNEK